MLGEFFRCNWEVTESMPPLVGTKPTDTTEPSADKPVTISFLTEQTSHHPPVSAYYVYCPEKGISARGIDQLSGSFTGTRIRVIPGEYNLGIFVTLHKFDDEQYHLKHPSAFLGGLMRGMLALSQAEGVELTR